MENTLKDLRIDTRAGLLFTWLGSLFVVMYSIGMLVAGLFHQAIRTLAPWK